jgi:flagellar hook-length control protein FliK
MMMTVGPKVGIASNPLETGAADGTAGAAGMGDVFLRMLCGTQSPLTLEKGAPASLEGLPAGEGQENLTIKTFQKLLVGNSGETEPQLASGDDALTKEQADKLADGTEAAAMLSLGIAVPTPLAPAALEGAFTVPPAVGEKPTGDARAALLASAFAASPAAAMIVAGKGIAAANGETVETGDAVTEAAVKPGLDFKMPQAAKAEATGPAGSMDPVALTSSDDAQSAVPAAVETAAQVETPMAEARPTAQPNPLNSFLAAALQPTTAPTAPVDASAATATAQPNEMVDAGLEQQLDLAHEGEWLDRLARDIARSSGTEGALRFRLNPEHLGTLHVQLTQGDAGASLRLTADSEAARAIIADAQPRLVAEARAQGVRIAETHVDLGGGHSAAGEQRRHDGERPQAFIRTDRLGASSEGEAPASAVNPSERYA